ncbi:hypothetical protein AVEN_207053-1, partial [Araneus ventricosus]
AKGKVANRTSEILDLIPWNSWRYVPTKESPADISSRGVSPKDLPDCRLWWEGLPYLSSPEDDWPKQPVLKDSDQHVLKGRKKPTFVFSVFLKNDIIGALIEKYSSYTKLIYVLPFCIRFINNCKVGKANEHFTGKTRPLTSTKRILADNLIVSYVQNVSLNEDISCIKENKQLSKNSTLLSLCPFIDQDGLLRVGGRLQNAPLHYNAKHPAILPNEHKLSNSIVQYCHILNLHAGGNVLMGILRHTYWIINVKKLIRNVFIIVSYAVDLKVTCPNKNWENSLKID